MEYEIDDGVNKIGWNMDMLLRELILPQNIEKIKTSYLKNSSKKQNKKDCHCNLIQCYSDHLSR